MRLALTLAAGLVLAPLAAPTHALASDLAPGRHVLRGEKIQICNAIGAATLVPTDGADVVVEVTASGADGAKLRVAIDDCGGGKRLRVVYPSNRIADPKMGEHDRRETTLDGCCGPERIRFTRPGDGLDARADLVIRIPKGQKLTLGLGAGSVSAEKLDARLGIDTGSAPIVVKGMTGSLALDSGSGGATVEHFTGSLAIDSGSGDLEIERFQGTLAVDSGSGGVTLNRVRCDKIAIDSGSGGVTGDDIVAAALSVETGSGGIDLTRLSAKVVDFDNGSGGVRAELAESPGSLHIESGSGNVVLTADRDLDAKLEIWCSKRRLHLDLPVEASRIESDYFEGRAGNGAGLIVIESGSGNVSLKARPD
ncbi:MAG TPA: DUF4097 family beta strand repeat-containing protein [Candidatus Eisenbacteria bacterium]|nr:DUF4097 family beta strand repeat-containing protein [Candidatus Eisenbacteria bacterium]